MVEIEQGDLWRGDNTLTEYRVEAVTKKYVVISYGIEEAAVKRSVFEQAHTKIEPWFEVGKTYQKRIGVQYIFTVLASGNEEGKRWVTGREHRSDENRWWIENYTDVDTDFGHWEEV